MLDYYQILEIDTTADPAAVKRAYRKLARQYHPDTNPHPQAAEMFKNITEAYNILKDPVQKAIYDRERTHSQSWGHRDEVGNSNDLRDLFSNKIPDEWAKFYSGASTKGADLIQPVHISFLDSYTGTRLKLPVPGTDHVCSDCKGSGEKPLKEVRQCPACRGKGYFYQSGLIGGEQCMTCKGTGVLTSEPCDTCKGTGHNTNARFFTIDIPPGVRAGTKLRVKGRGEPGVGHNAEAGDLYIEIQINPHAEYAREGDDIIFRLSLHVHQAILGDKVSITTPGGEKITIKVPPGTEEGKRLRVRGKGMPIVGGGNGDLLARAQILIPHKVTPAQEQALRAYGEALEQGPRRKKA